MRAPLNRFESSIGFSTPRQKYKTSKESNRAYRRRRALDLPGLLAMERRVMLSVTSELASIHAAHLEVTQVINHAPSISGQNFNFAEHSANGVTVGTVAATDQDGDPLTYSILDGNSSNAFTIDSTTGILKVATSSVLDYLTQPDFSLTVNVSDGTLSDAATITIHLIKAAKTIPNTIQRISVSTLGVEANGKSDDVTRGPSMSSDGRFTVFVSQATNLIDGTTTAPGNVYVYDRTNQSVELIPAIDNGPPSIGAVRSPVISGDGRYVAYYDAGEIEVFDRTTRTTSLVPVDPEGPSISGTSDHPFISEDGRYITYEYDATISVGPTVTRTDIIVYDTQTGTSQIVSNASDNSPGDGLSLVPSISADGRYVAFESTSDNLVPNDTNAAEDGGVGRDIFVFDRQTLTTRRISISSTGAQADRRSSSPIISANGQFVAFESLADNLVPGGASGNSSIYVYDLSAGTIACVSRPPGSLTDFAFTPDISDDGRFVTFESQTDGLFPGDTPGDGIYVYDRQNKTYWRADTSSSGAVGDVYSKVPAISGNGAYVSFYSASDNLVTGDTNNNIDAFQAPVSKGVTAVPLPDLTGTFTSLKLGNATLNADDTVIPGDKITATFALSNLGQGASAGSIRIDFYAFDDSTFDGDDAIPPGALLLGTATHGSVAAGATVPVTATLTLPSTLQSGAFFIIADVDSLQKITETDESNNNPATADTLDAALMVGTFDNHANASLTVADVNDTVDTVKLSGGGSAELVETADGYDLNITGATSKTTFTLSAKKGTGNGSFMIHTVNVDTAVPNVAIAAAAVPAPVPTLKSFIATNGILTGTLNIPAGITSITLDQTSGDAAINITGGTSASPAPAITIRLIHNLTIDSSVPIKSITTNDWSTDNGSSSSIIAPSLGTLTVKGDKKTHLAGNFQADVILSNAAVKNTLGTVSIAGTVSGATFMAAGNIGAFTVGALHDSTLAAGFAGTKADLPLGLPTTLPTAATIASVTIKDIAGTGNGFDSSLIYAQTITTLTLQDVLTVDAISPPGVAAHTIKSYTRKDAAGKVVKKLSNLTTPTADADNDTPDDFTLKIL